ncbi:MAG TPA: hypothetical protein VE685_11165 [Thermoanaerobaculia bacterium]|nr:hypothetical protein [Thermoanaerobaculia bacterium]
MKLRTALLVFAFLLLTGSLVSASSTASADAPASSADGSVVLMTPADGVSGCPTDELAFLNPAPTEQSTGFCGSCGACAGGRIGQLCGFSGGRYFSCEYPYAEFCSDGKPKCYCWSGPLP